LGQTLAALLTVGLTLWASQPELALTLSMAVGAASVSPRKLWAAPLVIALVSMVGVLFYWLELPVVVGVGAAAGASATWLVPQQTDWLDYVNGGLGTLTGASLGLWVAAGCLPETLPIGLGALLTALLVGLGSAQGLLPAAFRFDQLSSLPTTRVIRATLRGSYCPPVQKAVSLYRRANGCGFPDVETRRGMAEVAVWVYRL
jgi:hypothetical protein